MRSIWFCHDRSYDLGAENDAIARSIRVGNGFSDPFRERTGPTAWKPPVFVYVIAAVYFLSGDQRYWVVRFTLALQAIAVVVAGCLVLRESRRLTVRWLGHFVFPCMLATSFHDFFQKTHDVGWLLLLTSFMWYRLSRLPTKEPSSIAAIAWGGFGGLVFLSSPVLGAAWMLSSAIWWLRFVASHYSSLSAYFGRIFVLTSIACAVVVAPWTVRNFVLFDRLIPVKSNAAFELWQAHCLDEDGVLDAETLHAHPWQLGTPKRRQYRELGEMQFVSHHWPIVKESILADPTEFARRVLNRGIAACLVYQPVHNMENSLEWPIFLTRLVYPIPFLGCIVLCCFSARPISQSAMAAVTIYWFGLFPYILISFYNRYSAGLLIVKMLIIILSFDLCFQKMRGIAGGYIPGLNLSDRSSP